MDAVLTLWTRARSAAATSRDSAETISRLLDFDPGALLVASRDGQIIGSVVAGFDGWRGHVYRVAVLPEHRLRGTGRELLSAAHERLRALGADTVNASVHDPDPGLAAFWRAVGYRPDAGLSRYSSELRN